MSMVFITNPTTTIAKIVSSMISILSKIVGLYKLYRLIPPSSPILHFFYILNYKF